MEYLLRMDYRWLLIKLLLVVERNMWLTGVREQKSSMWSQTGSGPQYSVN